MKRILLLLFFLFFTHLIHGQQIEKANYALATKFEPENVLKKIYSIGISPNWIKKSGRFWYDYNTSKGKKWYIVDPVKKQKREMFDNAKMAAELSRIMKQPFDPQHLPIFYCRLTKEEDGVTFTIGSKAIGGGSTGKFFYFEYNFEKNVLREISAPVKVRSNKPDWASISPDGNRIVFARNFNLYSVDRKGYEKLLANPDDKSVVEKQLTTDGVAYFGYSESKTEGRSPASIMWSPDSRHFAMSKNDSRKVPDMWVVNSMTQPRPTLKTFKYSMPGDSVSRQEYIMLYDVVAGKQQIVKAEMYKDQFVSLLSAPKSETKSGASGFVLWHGTNDYFYLTRTSRDLKRIDVLVADVKTGNVKPLIQESMSTFIETKQIRTIDGTNEFIHWSERDGWAHFYLYDNNGNLKNQITSGAWHCEDILRIDEKKRILYFRANGREHNEDPYYMHLYRVNFDGSGLKLLNPGNFEHLVDMNDDYTFFVDNYSRVNTVPASALYSTTGKKIMDLEKADLTSLFAAGYKFPEIFKVKADDGISDLFGVMYKPFDFDSTKTYPIVTYVYPGPQTELVDKRFSSPDKYTDLLAQIGLIVVTVGNRGGSPSRSKWYHNYGYGNIRDYAIADKKTALEQLADRHKYIDIKRVGIHGQSGGGSLSTTAMLTYPDFFKVGISLSGNHDNSIYSRWWNEKYNGVMEEIGKKGDTTFTYSVKKNTELAKNLKGRLMLMTGDMDDNVVPAHTFRMAHALMKANKRFDMVVFPGEGHGYGGINKWYFWAIADYYARWLMNNSALPVDIVEMDKYN